MQDIGYFFRGQLDERMVAQPLLPIVKGGLSHCINTNDFSGHHYIDTKCLPFRIIRHIITDKPTNFDNQIDIYNNIRKEKKEYLEQKIFSVLESVDTIH